MSSNIIPPRTSRVRPCPMRVLAIRSPSAIRSPESSRNPQVLANGERKPRPNCGSASHEPRRRASLAAINARRLIVALRPIPSATQALSQSSHKPGGEAINGITPRDPTKPMTRHHATLSANQASSHGLAAIRNCQADRRNHHEHPDRPSNKQPHAGPVGESNNNRIRYSRRKPMSQSVNLATSYRAGQRHQHEPSD